VARSAMRRRGRHGGDDIHVRRHYAAGHSVTQQVPERVLDEQTVGIAGDRRRDQASAKEAGDGELGLHHLCVRLGRGSASTGILPKRALKRGEKVGHLTP
jgi:hypothetical protein